MNQIAPKSPRERLERTVKRIEAACRDASRPTDSVLLLAVSKRHPVEAIRELHGLGQHAFGENYVDEGVAKIRELADLDLEWHYIGPIQSNKTKLIAAYFDWVESIDRAKIVRRLDDQRPDEAGPLNVLIQVNLDDESQKAGCKPGDIEALAAQIDESERLTLRGLMAIPAPREAYEDQRKVFARLHTLFEALKKQYPEIDTISAGMTADLEAAIAEGSTLVRVGTALFGPRE
ncbi:MULTISPECIES: YggS family pyridoxal phosphate-dependent enzyme [unclassified Wenzhouxiangella]|uniref:YggS family pyridoxal phosphate-dependent enzyme n=1 Tax=unclassified Wenzhouxiangella TaxID=2613841 RepID=UPI000E3295CC|nr:MULTISPECIES: YggS family pyridoxal phosphate-dependent enzyme [unclassified Wenzhouxiangella]RFF26949.1 YggS family pyridoxal phosphate-dependent enzyme [Wenzhouxiangella sp. 15181]RFP69462.1 YggS family pyridoxal phosphate-dependent enzyme [Wenzhouxiangella sp. 15190]